MSHSRWWHPHWTIKKAYDEQDTPWNVLFHSLSFRSTRNAEKERNHFSSDIKVWIFSFSHLQMPDESMKSITSTWCSSCLSSRFFSVIDVNAKERREKGWRDWMQFECSLKCVRKIDFTCFDWVDEDEDGKRETFTRERLLVFPVRRNWARRMSPKTY